MTTDQTLAEMDSQSAAPSEAAQKAAWTARHPVNIRFTLPFFGGGYYFTFLAGCERRSGARRQEERDRHPLATRANIIALAVAGTITGLALLGLLQFLSVLVLQDAGVVTFSE